MIRRLLRIEFSKLWASNYFRVLGILWLFAFLAIPIGTSLILNNVAVDGDLSEMFLQISPENLPIFHFRDIWQNLAWVYKFQTLLLSFMVIISVTSEFDYKTVRQNIIDGFSRTHFWMSKVMLVLILASLATGLMFVEGMVAGLWASPDRSFEAFFANIEFVGAYFLHVNVFLLFCMMISLLIRRSGFTIFFLLIWNYVFEGIAYLYNLAKYQSDQLDTMLYTEWLPLESASNLIRQPVGKYALSNVQDYVATQDYLFAMGWAVLLLFFSHRYIQCRDF
ncbi:MAG: hypothetical protein ACON34_02560 [Flavobacteriales bacterium]